MARPALFGACDGSRPGVGRRLWHAGQKGLRQGIDACEPRLRCQRHAEHTLSHLDQGRGYALLGPR